MAGKPGESRESQREASRAGTRGSSTSSRSTARSDKGWAGAVLGGMGPGHAAEAAGKGWAGSQLGASAGEQTKAEGGNKLAPTVIPLDGKVPPGALADVEDASWGQMLGLAAKLLPGGIGFANDAEEGLDALTGGNFSGVSKGGILGAALDDALGDTPGKQTGWRPDRYRGENSMGGIGGSGGAPGNQGDEREIPGRSIGAGTRALTGDPEDDASSGGTGVYTDVMLRDRRKPRGAGTQMLLA